MPTVSSSRPHRVLAVVGLVIAIVSLQACSDSGGDGGNGSSSGLIPGAGGASASGVSDERLLSSAASAAGSLALNLDTLQLIADDDNDALSGMGSDVPSFTETGNDTETFLATTLGRDQPGARIAREGNLITVDPDDAAVCREDVPLTSLEDDNPSLCQQLVADLIIRVDAQTEGSGLITYLFDNAPVLLIGYAPNAANYELKLPGLQRVVQRSDELQGLQPSVPATFQGSLRLGSSISNDAPGAEAGEIKLEVVDAIEIRDADSPAGIALAPSTVIAIASNAADQSASMNIDWGALSITSESGDSLGNTSLSSIALGGLSGSLDVSQNSPDVQIRNLGIGDVPLTITIDSVESLRFGFDTLGVTIDNETGEATIDGALGVSLAINNLMGLLEDAAPEFTASLQLAAPSGTSFVEQDNGATLVSGGGPVTSSFLASDNSDSVQSDSTVSAGSCFQIGGSDEDDELPLTGSVTQPGPSEDEPGMTDAVPGVLQTAPCD